MDNNRNHDGMNAQTERVTQQHPARNDEQKEVNTKSSKRLAIIDLSLFLGGILLMGIATVSFYAFGALCAESEVLFGIVFVVSGIIFMIGVASYLASFILMIILRVRDKYNVIGLILMVIHILIFAAIVISCVIAVLSIGVFGCATVVLLQILQEAVRNCPG